MAQSPVEQLDGGNVLLRVPEPLHNAAFGKVPKHAGLEKSYPVNRITYKSIPRKEAEAIIEKVADWIEREGTTDTHTASRGRLWVRKVCDRLGIETPAGAQAQAREAKPKRAKGEPKDRTPKRKATTAKVEVGDQVKTVDWPSDGDVDDTRYTVTGFGESEKWGKYANLKDGGQAVHSVPIDRLVLVGRAKRNSQNVAAKVEAQKKASTKRVTRKAVGRTAAKRGGGPKETALRKAREAKAKKKGR